MANILTGLPMTTTQNRVGNVHHLYGTLSRQFALSERLGSWSFVDGSYATISVATWAGGSRL